MQVIQERVREEAPVIEADRRLPAALSGVDRKFYLRPVSEFVAPECAIPDAIQFVERSILLFEPYLKCRLSDGIVFLKWIAGLVIELPANNSGIVAIMIG